MMLDGEGIQALSLSIEVRHRQQSCIICKLRLLFEVIESGSAQGQETGRGCFALRTGACQSVEVEMQARPSVILNTGSGVGRDAGIPSAFGCEEF